MYKNRFFIEVAKVIGKLQNVGSEIKFIFMSLTGLLVAIVFIWNLYDKWKNPLVEKPGNIIEHLSNIPILFALIASGIVALLMLVMITMFSTTLKKVNFSKLGIEFENAKTLDKQESIRSFETVMLDKRDSILKNVNIKTSGNVDGYSITEELLNFYENFINIELGNPIVFTEIKSDESDLTTQERKLVKFSESQEVKAAYDNRITDENLMVGFVDLYEGEDRLFIIIKSGKDRSFDKDDRYAIETMIRMISVLYDLDAAATTIRNMTSTRV